MYGTLLLSCSREFNWLWSSWLVSTWVLDILSPGLNTLIPSPSRLSKGEYLRANTMS